MELGKFEILEELGRGGFGIVYKARDKALNRLVAIKVLHPNLVNDPTFLGRFRQEAQIAARLDHPNLVPVHDFGEAEGHYYIVMGYMPGGSLKDLIKHEGSLIPKRALEIMGQIAAGLTYAHKKSVIHRDLKPGNILFDEEGTARISDMGFAKLLQSDSSMSMSTSGGLVGTPAYMAPEIWKGEASTAAVDVYSSACILVEMLTGKPLFDGDSTPVVILKHLQPVNLPETLPSGWKPVISRTLEKEPGKRFGSVDQFMRELKQADEQVLVRPSHEKEKFFHTDDVREEARNPVQSHSGVGEEHFHSTDPISKETQKTRSGFEVEKPNILKNKTLLYLEIGVLVLLAIFLIVRSGIFSARPQSTTEPEVFQVQDTATKEPDPSQTPTQTPTLTPTRMNTPQPIKTTTSTPKPTSTPILGIGSTKVRWKDGMEMVYVPEGSFEMGSTTGYDDEKYVRQVFLDAFWIDKFEVTNSQYGQCVDAEFCTEPMRKDSATRISYFDYDFHANFPVINVNWSQAQDYCEWVGGKLPTEAQWEKAARGTDGRKYPWGDNAPNDELANYGRYVGDTLTVGIYPNGASPYGALDMAGNVSEWVHDWYGAYQPLDTNNPTGPDDGTRRVLRGGSWVSDIGVIRTSDRYNVGSTYTNYLIGFRCVSRP